MAEKVTNTVILNVDSKGAEQDVNKLGKSINDLDKDSKKSSKSVSKDFDNVSKKAKKAGKETEKAGKKSGKGFKLLGRGAKVAKKGIGVFNIGLKAVGATLKALGIGLIISAIALLFETLKENQKVMDAFNIALETVGGFVNQVVDALTDTYDKLMENKKGFEAFKKTIMGLITLALTPLKLQFYNIERVILAARLAWEESFLGSGDTETIDSLNKSLDENADNIKQTGLDAIEAGKDIKNNIGESIDFIKEGATTATEELSKVSGKAAFENAKTSNSLKKTAQLNTAELQGSIERYDRLAEKERQRRDDINATYADRLKASKKLGEILDEQEKKELQLADTKIAAAAAELKNNKDNVDLQQALIEAQNERAAVEARIEGKRSAYLSQNNALQKETMEAMKQIRQFSLEGYELEKQAFKDTYEEQKKLIEKTIEDEEEKNRLLLKAKERYNEKVIDLENERVRSINEILRVDAETKREKAIEELEREREEKLRELEELEATEEEKAALILKYKKKIDDANKDFNEQEKEDREKTLDANVKMTGQAATAIADAIDAGADLQKSIATAQALWNTYKGITVALGEPTMVQRIAGVAFASATGFAAVKDIMSTTKENAGGKAGGGNQGGGFRQANFNTVGDTRANAEIEEAQDREPTMAYVVGSEVTTQQEADRNRVKNSTFLD